MYRTVQLRQCNSVKASSPRFSPWSISQTLAMMGWFGSHVKPSYAGVCSKATINMSTWEDVLSSEIWTV